MAEEKELELAEPAGSSKKLIIILVAIIVLLVLGGGGAMVYMSGILSFEEAAVPESEEAVVEETKKPAIYVDLDPAFTVNLDGASKAKYLQVSLQALVRDPEVEDLLRKHRPLIRSNLVLVFSSKTSQELVTREGKQGLQTAALKTIQKVLKDETGQEGVENVFFTTFVMQ